jgi:hypothetical protein
MVPLGMFGGSASAAYGVSPSGEVVVGMALEGADFKPFRWTEQTGLQQLGAVGGFGRGAALDSNDSGTVVGASFSYQLNIGDHLAFRWDPVAGIQSLGTLGGSNSIARSVNAGGVVVGWSNAAGGGDGRAFIWTEPLGMRTLAGLENLTSIAQDVSDSGYVTGAVGGRPMLWRETLLSADMGLPVGFTTAGAGNAVNNDGIVVGHAHNGFALRAMLWRLGDAPINLDAWLDAADPGAGAIWTLEEATDITDAGIITGYGVYNDGPGGLPDGQRAFLLDASSIIPEPTSACALTCAALLLSRSARPQRQR